jgi:hypothetical protein
LGSGLSFDAASRRLHIRDGRLDVTCRRFSFRAVARGLAVSAPLRFHRLFVLFGFMTKALPHLGHFWLMVAEVEDASLPRISGRDNAFQ